MLEPGDSAARTVLVYMMAENSLNGYLYGDEQDGEDGDMDEMKNGASSIPDSCYLLAFVDARDAKPYICRIRKGQSGNAVCETVYKFQNDFYSTDSCKFHEVVSWVLDYFPSKNFGLVMWSHGSGWLYSANRSRSIGEDKGTDHNSTGSAHWMEVEELAAVLKELPVKTDYVLFDACFMQCVEVAYAMRESAEWLVGSPAEIPGKGAPYDKIMPFLFSFPFDAKGLIEQYKSGYPEYEGTVLSAVKCEGVEYLAEVTAAFVPAFFSRSFKVDESGVFSYLPNGYFWDSVSMPDFYDMNGQMMLRLPDDAYVMWKEAFDAAVPYKVASSRWYSIYNDKNRFNNVDFSQFGGLSMYVPRFNNIYYSTLNKNFKKTAWYQATGWESAGW